MSQIFEYTKHSDRYLIHCFRFEGNDRMNMGHFVGNYTMNKFMSPIDWHMIFEHLNKSIEKYLKRPQTKRPNALVDVLDTNIELNVEWIEMDMTFYGKMFPAIDLKMAYPFVMVTNVGCKSNLDKFIPAAGNRSSQTTNNESSPSTSKAKIPTIKTPTAVAPASNARTPTPKSAKKSKDSLATSSTSVTVGSAIDTTLSKTIGSNGFANGTRPFTIPLDRLTVNDIERLIGTTCATVPMAGGKKRKHQLLNDSDVSTPQKEMQPPKRPAPETPFVNSVNSTPYVRHSKNGPDPIEETDVSRISAENHKSPKTKAGPKSNKTKKINMKKNHLTKTPLSSKRNGVKSAKIAKPRLQVSIGHLTAKPKKLSKVKKSMHKDKKSKKSSKLVNGESLSLEIVEDSESDQQPSTSRASNDKENHIPKKQSNSRPQPIDLKNLTEDQVIAGFYRNKASLTALFKQNVRQDEIQRAGDYTAIDIITLLTHEQFSKMLDILFEHFKGYRNEEVETIFFDIMIPEWTLAIFMREMSLSRDAALEIIYSQKTEKHDQSTMLSYISFKQEQETADSEDGQNKI